MKPTRLVVLALLGLLVAVPPAAAQQDPFAIPQALSGQAVFSAQALTVNGGAVVDSSGVAGGSGAGSEGHVVSNSDITLNGKSKVKGSAWYGPGKKIVLNGGSTVSGTTAALAAARDAAPIALSGLAATLAASNDNALIGKTSRNRSPLQGSGGTDFVLNGNETITIPAGTFYFTTITINGSSKLSFSGLTRILCTGPVTVNGTSTVHQNGNPWLLRLWVSGAQVTLNGNSTLNGFVYSPSAAATVDGGGILTGGLFAQKVTVNGGGRVTRSFDDTSALAATVTNAGQPIANGAVFRAEVAPVVTVTGGVPPLATRVTLDGAPFVSGTTVSAEGVHRLVVVSDDLAGRHLELTVGFVIDRSGPSLAIVRPANGEVVGTAPVDVTGTSGDATSVSVNGVAGTVAGGSFVVRGVPLAEGTNTLVAAGADAAGNAGSATSVVVLDTGAPVLTVASPADGLLTKAETALLQGAVSDPHLTSLTVNGLPISVPSGGGAFSREVALVEGANALTVEARDVVGHIASRSLTVRRDGVAPEIRIEEGNLPLEAGRAYNRDLTIRVTVVEANPGTLEVTLDGATFVSGATVSAEGAHTLSATAVDGAGNSASKTVSFSIDKTAPSLSITTPTPGSTILDLPRTLAGTSGDAVTVDVDGTVVAPAGGAFSIPAFPFAEGPVTVTATGTDAAGNSGTATATYLVDTLPPQVTIASPLEGVRLGAAPIFVTGVASDANLLEVRVNGQAASLGSDGSFQAGPFRPGDGPVTFTAVATDRASRFGRADRSVVVDTTPPEIAIRNASTSAPMLPGQLFKTPVMLAVSVTDATTPAQTTHTVTVDGTPYGGGPVSGEGSHLVEVVATDGAGNTATASVGFVVDTIRPVFSALLPEHGSVGRSTPVTVSGRVSADTESVTVSGQPATCAGGAFSLAGVSLSEGPNDLLLVATDRAGNEEKTTLRVVLDTTNPSLTIASPAEGALLGSLSVTVTGAATDANLESVTVEGGAAALQPDGSFSRAGVTLVEGPGTITATARDRAGNTATTSVHVVADSLPPTVRITAPGPGAVLGQSPAAVSGTATDAHLGSVTVNGVAANVDDAGRFTASVPLTEGSNTLTATASDTLGRTAQASVVVSLDTAAPNVTITSPTDGARFRTTPQTVRGTVDSDLNLEGVTVNGVAATTNGTSFEASVPLIEGTNALTARARKATGKEGTARIDVVFDTTAPTLAASAPADGQSGVALSPVFRLTFSEALDASTVVPSAFVLTAPGASAPSLAATLGGAGSNVVTLVPAAALAEATEYTLSVAASVADLAGNGLAAPLTIRFTTVDQTPPPAPVLDAVPELLCAEAVTLSGTSEAGAILAVSGGAAGAQGLAGPDGRFSVPVPLAPAATQTLSVTARDASGNVSPAASVVLTVDCEPPHVVDVTLSSAGLVVALDEPLRPTSVVAGESVRLDTPGGTPIAAAVALSGGDATLTVTAGGVDLTAVAFTLSLSSGVQDRAGNALVPFVRTFEPQSVATLLLGEAFDDSVGRPLGGATATLLVSAGVETSEPRPYATATAAGGFVLPALPGDALVRVGATGYLDVYRRESVVAGGSGSPVSTTLFDVRLTPIADPASAKPTAGGTLYTATAGSRVATLEAPAASVPPDVVVRLTVRRPQGLPVLAPLGWSVASAARVAISDAAGAPVAPTGAMTLRLPDFYGATTSTALHLARLDPVSLQWQSEGAATLRDGALEAILSAAGDWAILVPDPAPTAPGTLAPGAPLPGVALPAEDPLESASVVADPVDVLPTQASDVSLTVVAPVPVPSGYPVQTLVTEELTLLDGSRLAGPSFLADLSLLRRGDGSLGLSIPVRASEGAGRVALSVGYERFAVKKFPFEVRRGVVVGPTGGTATGSSGWAATLPTGAVSGSTSVALTAIGVSELPASVPQGFDFLAAVRLATGGVAFDLPVVLSKSGAAAPPAGAELLVVAFEERSGFLLTRPVARASYDAASQTLRSSLIDRALFPWPGVRNEGVYAFLAAIDPLAFVAGRVLDVDATALRDTLVSVGGGWTLQAVSETDGTFALAIRAAASTLSAVRTGTGNLGQLIVTPATPGQEITGVELRLAHTAPWVAGVTPAAGSTVLVGSRFTVTFSEAIDPLSLTPASFFLVATVEGQPVVVPSETLVDPSGLSATLVPAGALPSRLPLALGVSRTVRDRNGYGLVDALTKLPADFAVAYTTEDLTPPDAKPWLVRIGLPTGNPQTVVITGAPGAVCGGCHVVAFNDTTLATASTDALSDGSFTLTLVARATDAIRVEIEKANGTKQTLPPVPFTDDGGRTVLVGEKGGSWETPEGFRVTVPASAFAGPVPVVTERVSPEAFQTLVAPPRDVAFVDAFRMDFATPATSGFDLSFAAPATSATDQFFLAQVVEVLGQRRLMVVDLLVRQGGRLVTDRSHTLQSLSQQGYVALVDPKATAVGGVVRVDAQLLSVQALGGPGSQIDDPKSFFDGIYEKGTYALYNAAVKMATVAGGLGGGATVATSSASDFLFDSLHALTRKYFRLLTPVGEPFDLTLVDRDTGLSLFEGTYSAPTGAGTVVLLNPPNPDQRRPGVLAAGPSPTYRFDAPPAGGDLYAIAEGIKAYSGVSAEGSITVTVEVQAGTVPAGALLRLVNFNRAGSAFTAVPGGVATLRLPDAQAGDPLGLTVENTTAPVEPVLRIAFDEKMKAQGGDWKQHVSVDVRGAAQQPPCPVVGYDVLEQGSDGTSVRELLVVPGTKGAPGTPPGGSIGWLRAGCRYTLRIRNSAVDLNGNGMANDFLADFAPPDDDPIGTQTATSFVRKVLYHGGLLLATGEDQTIRVYDARVPGTIGLSCDMQAPAAPPAVPEACPSGPTTAHVPLPGVGRDLLVDRFGRLVVVGGGTSDGQGASPGYGFLRLYDFVPTCGSPTRDCGRRIAPRGTTIISAAVGSDTLTYPPQGTPRKIALQEEVQERTWRIDADDNTAAVPPQTGTRVTLDLPWPSCDPPVLAGEAPVLSIQKSGPEARQGPRQPYRITSASVFPPSPRCHKRRFFSFTNLATGEVAYARTDENGAGLFPVRGAGAGVTLTASSGDRIRVQVNGASVALVDVLGYGVAVVDLDAVYDPDDVAGGAPDASDPTLPSKLLVAYTGSSPSSGPSPCRDGNSGGTTKTCDVPYQRCGEQLTCDLRAAIGNTAPPGYPPVYKYGINDLLALTGIAVRKTEEPGVAWGFGSLNGFGLLSFSIDLRAAESPHGSLLIGRERTFATGDGTTATIRNGHPIGLVNALPLEIVGTTATARANDVALAEAVTPPAHPWFCNGVWGRGDAPRDLAFVAAGNNGVFVVDVSTPARPAEMGRFETRGGALAVSVDAVRKLLYVSDAGEGMKVFSFEDPCGSTPGTDSSVDDPRLVATYPPAAGSLGNTPISVDPDTGIVYGSSTGSGSSVVHGFDLVPPPLYAVADSDDDGRLERLTEVIPLGVPNPGKREAVPDPGAPAAGHATYTPESFSVLAFLPGGELETGETIHVDVFATTVTGGRLPESAPGFPKSALRDLVLRRQSDDPSDAAYNRYQSDPIVVVADPRAQYAYARTVAENDPEKPDACRNCVPAADVAAKLRTQPAPDERLEILSGEKIRIRFSESLKASRPYLAEVDLERSALDLTSVRADLTPGLKQAPVLSGNSVLGVATHSREYSASAVDLSLAGRMLDLSIDRTYRSQVLHDGPLGRNQDSALFERLRPLPSGDVEYYDGMARRHTFAYEKDSASYDSPAGIASVLSKSSEGEYVLLHPDRSSTLFDATGRKRAYRDRHATAQSTTDGNRHLFEYDGEGRLASIVDDAGRRTRLVWDEGRLEQVKDFDGRTVDYTLVSARLETVTGPDPQDPSSERPVSRYTWGTASGDLRGRLFSSGRIETVSDGGTNAPATFTVGYAEDGAVSSVTTVDGTTGFTAPSASTVDVTDPKSATTTFTHQESGQVVKVKDAAGYETEFEYRGSVTKKGAPRADGLPWKTRLPEGQVIENTYGDLGDIDRIRHFNLTSTERRPKPGSSDAPLRTEISYDWRSLPTSVIRRDASTTPRPPLVTTIGRKSNGDVTSISEPGTASVGITTDNFGRPLVVGDSSGRSETRTYDDRPGYTGQLKSTTISGGETAPVSTVYERDARGNVLSTQDGAGRRVTYDVNKLDQTWRETRGGASPGVTSYRFDATGQVKEQDRVLFTPQGQEPDRSITGYVYDPLGRLKNRSASDSGTTTYGYDGQGNLKTVTTPQGTTTYTYDDPRGLLTGVTPSTGGTTTYAYNGNGTRISSTNPRLGKTTYLLDGHDRPRGSHDLTTRLFESTSTDGLGRVRSRRAYEATDPASPLALYSWAEYEYDDAGRQTKETRKLFSPPMPPPFDAPVTDVVTETRYDEHGRVSDVVDPLGRTTHTEYDEQGRVRKTVDPVGNEVLTDYDAAGNGWKTTVKEKNGAGWDEYVTERVYDEQGRLEKVVEKGLSASPLLRETRYEYDQAGRKTKETDPDGGVTTWEYDKAGRKTKETSPVGAVTTWDYDLAGNLVRLTDANGNKTTYAYDSEGRLTYETRGDPVQTSDSPTLPTWKTTWDSMGNRVTVRDPNGTVVTYNYDDAGRLTGRTIAKATGVEGPAEEAKILDPLGRPTAWTSTGSGVDQAGTAVFDSLDRLTRETLRLGAGPVRTIGHEYDLASQETALTYPSGRRYALEPDPLGRLREVRDPAGFSVVRYEDTGRRQTRKTFGNNLVEERTYGPAAWLKTLTVSNPSVPSPLLGLDYATRNLRGLKLDVVRADRGTKDAYVYDPAGRITSESLGLPEPPPAPPAVATPDIQNVYTLDGLLNIERRERTQAGATVVSEPGAAATGINDRNQYTHWGTSPSYEPLTYDPNGNLTAFSGTTLRYDVENRLATATTGAGAYSAFYDPDGQRVREVRTSGGSTVELDVVQSGQRVLEVFPKDGTTPLQRFVYGRGIDEVVLADLDPSATGTPTAVYPLQDELGNVTHLTDASGSVVERYDYEGYGKFRIFDATGSSRSASAFGWNRLFQGREYLGLIDAYDFRARTLWPELGSFGQEDPAGTIDSLNRYQALVGNWTGYVDPFGFAAATDPDLPFILLRIQAAADEAARRHGVTDWDTMLKSGAKGDPIHLTFQELLMDPSSPYYHPRVVTEVDVGVDGVVQLFGPRGARRRGALIKDTVILKPGLTSSSVVPRATRARDVVTLVVDLKIGKGARSRQTATFSRFGSPMVRLQPFNDAKGLFRRVAATGKTVRRLRALTPILKVAPAVAFLVGADMTLDEVRAALSRGDINRAAATLAGVDFLEDAVVDLGNLTEASVRDWLTRKGATGEARSRVLVEVDSQ